MLLLLPVICQPGGCCLLAKSCSSYIQYLGRLMATSAGLQVAMSLNAPEIVVQPSINDAKKVLGRLARNLVECSKPFVRWMDGTCIEAPEIRGAAEDDEPFVHNFFLDVSQNPQIVKTMLALTHSIQKVIFSFNR